MHYARPRYIYPGQTVAACTCSGDWFCKKQNSTNPLHNPPLHPLAPRPCARRPGAAFLSVCEWGGRYARGGFASAARSTPPSSSDGWCSTTPTSCPTTRAARAPTGRCASGPSHNARGGTCQNLRAPQPCKRTHTTALAPLQPALARRETATPPLPLRRRASRAQLKGVVPLKAGSVKVDPLGSLRIALHVFGERTYTFEALDGAGYDKWVLALRGALPESPSGVDTHPRTALPTSGGSAEPRTPSTMEPIFPDVSDTPVAPPPDAAADASPDAAADAAPLWHRAVRLQAQMGDQINIHGNLGATSPGAAAAAAWDDAHLPSAPSTPSREAAEGALSPPSPPASATGHSLPPASTLAVATPPSEAAHAVATLSPVGASIPERGGFTPAGRLVWLPVDDEDAWVRSSRRQPLPSHLAPPAAPVAPRAASRSRRSSRRQPLQSHHLLLCSHALHRAHRDPLCRAHRCSLPSPAATAATSWRRGNAHHRVSRSVCGSRRRRWQNCSQVRLAPDTLSPPALTGTRSHRRSPAHARHWDTRSPALTGTRALTCSLFASASASPRFMSPAPLRLHLTASPPPLPRERPCSQRCVGGTSRRLDEARIDLDRGRAAHAAPAPRASPRLHFHRPNRARAQPVHAHRRVRSGAPRRARAGRRPGHAAAARLQRGAIGVHGDGTHRWAAGRSVHGLDPHTPR